MGIPRTNEKCVYYTSFDETLFNFFLEEKVKVIKIGRNKMAIHISGEDLRDALEGLQTASKFRILDIDPGSFKKAVREAVMLEVAEIHKRNTLWHKIKRWFFAIED